MAQKMEMDNYFVLYRLYNYDSHGDSSNVYCGALILAMDDDYLGISPC